MQGDFEKKVQEKLDGLRLSPSAPVWDKIEREIRPEEKRRRGLFWIPLILLLLGGGWWLLTSRQLPQPQSSTMAPATKLPARTVSPPTGEQISTTMPTINKIGKSNHLVATVNNNRKLKLQPTTRANNRSFAVSTKEVTATLENNPDPVAPGLKTSNEKASFDNRTGKTTGEPINETQGVVPGQTTTPGSADTTVEANKTGTAEQPVVTDTVARKTRIASAAKWRKTITLHGGVSSPSAGGGIFGGAVARDNYSTTPFPNTSAGGGFGMMPESPVKKGFSFAVGAGLSRQVGKRWDLSIGLQYAFYSTRMNVGDYRELDTAISYAGVSNRVNGFYSNGRQNGYTNRYHVLELPVSVSYRPSLKWPLTVAVGASYGRLLQSNALTFDRGGNLYYRNQEAMTKNFAAVFSSLQFRLLKGKSWSLEAGPVVQYHLSRVQTENRTAPRLFFAGVKTGVDF